mmetsp:Transcript_20235/g.63656  ORF Transcript_20235/g.63656 Transcript_20235/m.63656 type:complete len:87 (+) Transcript_20235:1409-1669(+)
MRVVVRPPNELKNGSSCRAPGTPYAGRANIVRATYAPAGFELDRFGFDFVHEAGTPFLRFNKVFLDGHGRLCGVRDFGRLSAALFC